MLIKAPSVYPYWYDEWDEQVRSYADMNNILYLNTVKESDNIGIDYSTDTFDYGQHLNVDGAEKLSMYIGKRLTDSFSLKDHRNEPAYTQMWNPVVEAYYREKTEKMNADK